MNENLLKVLDIIRQVKPSLEELDETTILNDGAIDSLDIITIIELMEKEFCIEIAGNCLKQENFETAYSLTKMVEEIGGGCSK